MEVFHHVPTERLTVSYFRRWWFGKGISRARVDRMHPVTELGIDLRTTAHLAGVPKFMVGDAARDSWRWLHACVRRAAPERIRLETQLAYFLGYALERQWNRRRTASDTDSESAPPVISRHEETELPRSLGVSREPLGVSHSRA
jgi:hypothetical protein